MRKDISVYVGKDGNEHSNILVSTTQSDRMSQALMSTTMEPYVSFVLTVSFLTLVASYWYRPSRSKFPEFGGDNTEALLNVVKKQWSQVRNACRGSLMHPANSDEVCDNRCEEPYTCYAFLFVRSTCYHKNTLTNTFGCPTIRLAQTPTFKSGCLVGGPTSGL